jgi:hypothetical protein
MVEDRGVTDLLVTNFVGRLELVPNRLRSELKGVIAARDAALSERDGAIAARDAALSERDALLHSSSWRITAPLRSLSSVVRLR